MASFEYFTIALNEILKKINLEKAFLIAGIGGMLMSTFQGYDLGLYVSAVTLVYGSFFRLIELGTEQVLRQNASKHWLTKILLFLLKILIAFAIVVFILGYGDFIRKIFYSQGFPA